MKYSLWYFFPIINWVYIFYDRNKFKDEGVWLMILCLLCLYNLILFERVPKFILTVILMYI